MSFQFQNFDKIYLYCFNEIIKILNSYIGPLYNAIKRYNLEIVNLLLSNEKIDINSYFISN